MRLQVKLKNGDRLEIEPAAREWLVASGCTASSGITYFQGDEISPQEIETVEAAFAGDWR